MHEALHHTVLTRLLDADDLSDAAINLVDGSAGPGRPCPPPATPPS
jgi:hypothetical protein